MNYFNYEIETFKAIKKNKSDKNNTYGLKGSVGKSYFDRSFGGGMSNRKYTKDNVKKHKPAKTQNITSNINKSVTPPLFPVSLPSSSSTYRTGYVNTKNYIDQPKNIGKYYEPSQELNDINLNKGEGIHINNIVNDKNINDNANVNGGGNNGWNNNDGWNNNGWNWLNGAYNPFSYFNPYAPYFYPYDGINGTETVINDDSPKYNNSLFIAVIVILLLILIFKK